MKHFSLLILYLLSDIVFAQALQSGLSPSYQDIAQIKRSAENFVYGNTANLPGQVTVNIDKIDKNLNLPPCSNLESFMPTGGRLWGRTSVGVRCSDPNATWTIYVQAEVAVMTDVLHTAQPISVGQTITPDSIILQNANLTQMPDGILTNPNQAIGKVAASNLSAGQPIRPQMLRAPYVILRGQKVSLVIKGKGFSVSSEGQALADAADGQIVQVRNKTGKIVSGLARTNSIVEIQP